MAVNLAISIKANEPAMPIALIHDGCLSKVEPIHSMLFSHQIDATTTNGFEQKLNVYDLTPFDKTLYLDVDTVLLFNKSLFGLIASFTTQFEIANRGYNGHSDWMETNEWLNCSSECIYFEKSEKIKELFDHAKRFYKENTLVNRKIGGQQPDEPSFAYAISKTELELSLIPFYPCFWEGQENKYKSDQEIKEQYTLLSMGGKRVSNRLQQLYDRINKHYSGKLTMKGYKHQQKADVMKERRII